MKSNEIFGPFNYSFDTSSQRVQITNHTSTSKQFFFEMDVVKYSYSYARVVFVSDGGANLGYSQNLSGSGEEHLFGTFTTKDNTINLDYQRVDIKNLKIYALDLNNVYLTPKDVKSLGETTIALLYGNYNGEFNGGIFLGKSSTATTGSITLGNAVGYITVNFNGEIIKIPYYT